MSFTIAPLYNIGLPEGTNVSFGDGLTLREKPEWLREDRFVKELSYIDRDSIAFAKHAFVAEYEAHCISEPDDEWTGEESKSIQDRKLESIMIANMALWVAYPSPACFTIVLHALSWSIDGQIALPEVKGFHSEPPLYCHPDDVKKKLSINHVAQAAKVYVALRAVPPKNPVWTALRVFWSALTMQAEDLRYSFFWIGLEALFGPDSNTGEITYKLAQRIAFFIAEGPDEARATFHKAKACYSVRSQIVHGRWNNVKEMTTLTGDTESFVRAVLQRLADDPKLVPIFLSKKRDAFLEDSVFAGATASM